MHFTLKELLERHPTFLHAEEMTASALRRLIGFDANASSMDHQELEGSSSTRQDSREDWVEEMLKLKPTM